MLHEIILSLSGHPSPLLTTSSTRTIPETILSPPEKVLLASIADLSDLNCKLLRHTSEIPFDHTSSICQAVATAIKSTYLASFQQRVLEIENGILRRDAGSVGAYNIVPLTAIVGELSPWVRKMEWFWDIVQFMMSKTCTGSQLIDKLCTSVQTGYSDIEEAALNLVKVAETAWLKQASSWILYGRLPSFGKDDFFVHDGVNKYELEYIINPDLLPGFVSASTAACILFIGRSLNQIRVKGMESSGSLRLIPSHLRLLSSLSFPLTITGLSNAISAIRLSLSQNALQKILPLNRIMEILSLLHEFFLLGRGEFAMALIMEADEKIRGRWRRAENLAYDKRERPGDIAVKDGEVTAVLARTWAAMSTLQRSNDDDDDQLELARGLITLSISKSSIPNTPLKSSTFSKTLVSTPFSNLLLSIPTHLNLQIPSPVDLFLSPAEVQTYSAINVYLLSIRRAHVRLTDLWKISSLRRDHPAPPTPPYGSLVAGRLIAKKLRARAKHRGQKLRSVWATSSAAVFLLGEAETYFQGDVVNETWKGFQQWITGPSSRPPTATKDINDQDIWVTATTPKNIESSPQTHDPQTLSEAHKKYLGSLTQSLLLTVPSFTNTLYYLLQQIDHLVALVHRIHSIWQSLDLEVDEGVVDAFSDFQKEERDIEEQLMAVAERVKRAIEVVIQSLRDIDQEKDTRYDSGFDTIFDESAYVPEKVGRVDRLLMKLDFGGWFDVGKEDDKAGANDTGDDDE